MLATSNSSRIANGHPAKSNQFPYQVSISSPLSDGRTALCGGSVIHAAWVLTAAHCTDRRPQQNLRFGSIDRTSGGIAQTSFNAIIHPKFNREQGLNYDLSLIKLSKALQFGASIRSIQLPAASEANANLVNAIGTVSGWGNTGAAGSSVKDLRWVNMGIITNMRCRKVFGNTIVVEHVMCAVGDASPSNQGICGGDSGGPLALSVRQETLLYGVASFASASGCDRGKPSGFIRTAHFTSWISGHVRLEQ